VFIALAGALALMTALALALPFLRSRPEATDRAAYDAQAYRAQLTEIDQDVTRGVLTEAEATAAKIEISRRLLAATDEMEAGGDALPPAPGGLRRAVGIGAALGVPVLAAALYAGIGEPGRPDVPLASRTDFEAQMAQNPSQAQAEALFERAGYAPVPVPLDTPEAKRVAEMVAEVEAVLERKPDDTRGRRLLARTQVQLGRYGDAWRNYAMVVEQQKQPDVEIYGEMIETMTAATNGYVSPEAEIIADRGIALAPADPRFRHFKALALAQRGQNAEALVRWSAMLKDAEPGEPWVQMVYRHAAQVAGALNVPPPPIPAAPPGDAPDGTSDTPGPSRAEIAAASQMPEADRNAMIEGMVAGLAERLAEDPDDLQGWLRLIRAYAVLGRDDQRDKAVEMARSTFAGDTKALERIDEAGR